jgi:hypothetical protein
MRPHALVGICLAGLTVAGASAQERSLDETVAFVNRTLEEYSYVDHDGQPTVSQVELKKGILIVEVTKTKSGNKFTNVYEVALSDIDITRIKANERGGFASVSLGATGPVAVKLVCRMASGLVHEWDLPDTKDMAVELASDSPAKRELTRALMDLVAQARKDSRYAAT